MRQFALSAAAYTGDNNEYSLPTCIDGIGCWFSNPVFIASLGVSVDPDPGWNNGWWPTNMICPNADDRPEPRDRLSPQWKDIP